MAIKKIEEKIITSRSPLRMVGAGLKISQVYKKIILALEQQSLHPMAAAFRDAFYITEKLPPVGNPKEMPQLGVSGYIYGKLYSIKKNPNADLRFKSCALFEEDKHLFDFHFEAVDE